ncbi:hypothetical protein [Haladaptatus sp. NG-SE-30]
MTYQDKLDIDRRTWLKMTGGATSVPALLSAASARSGDGTA